MKRTLAILVVLMAFSWTGASFGQA